MSGAHDSPISGPSHVYLWPGMLMMISPGARNRLHRHLAASLLVGLDAPFDLKVGARRQRVDAALVAPDATQSLDTHGRPILVLHVDPDRDEFRRMAARLAGRPVVALPLATLSVAAPALGTLAARAPDCGGAAGLRDRLVAAVASDEAPRPLDSRIAQLVRELRATLPAKPDVAVLARQAGLSEFRLMHLFKREMHVPLRRFVLSLRLQKAMHLWNGRTTLADVAAAAGFYDQSHFVRTAREMLDFRPSLFADPRIVRVHACGGAPTAGSP